MLHGISEDQKGGNNDVRSNHLDKGTGIVRTADGKKEGYVGRLGNVI